MTDKNKLYMVLVGVLFGAVLGAAAHSLGVKYACPAETCVDSAQITPVTDRGYYEAAYRIISNAKTSIHIVAFEIKYYQNNPGSLQNRLIRELIYARERGVEVKVFVDEFSKENNAYEILEANGVEVKIDDKETTTHAKLIIVDGETVLIGSTNLSYFGLEKNREANILIRDEKTANYFEEYFRNLFNKKR